MNKEKASGKLDEVKGKIKEKAGEATNDPDTQAEGIKDQVKGNIKQADGDAKEKLTKDKYPSHGRSVARLRTPS